MKILFLLISKLLFFALVLLICFGPAIIELISAYTTKIQNQKQPEIEKECRKAAEAHYKAFNAWANEIAEDGPYSEKARRLHGRLITAEDAHRYFFKRFQAA